MTDTASPGLREQKRLATKRALQVALLTLSLERGFDNVTIEEVAQVAQVSPRTFFNYFASKEEAIAAPHVPAELPPEERSWYEGSVGDPVSDLITLMASKAQSEADLELHRLRRELMQRESRLLGDKISTVQRFHEQIVDMVTERLRADALRAGQMPDEAAIRSRAAFITMLSVTIARHGWSRWVAGEGVEALGDSIMGALGEFREIAIATIP